MSENHNDEKKKRSISTGNPLLDIGLGVFAAVAGTIAGEIIHRGSEIKSRNKAKEIAVETNNKQL